jgi:hypothetical protein
VIGIAAITLSDRSWRKRRGTPATSRLIVATTVPTANELKAERDDEDAAEREMQARSRRAPPLADAHDDLGADTWGC